MNNFTPLTELTKEDIKNLHIHSTLDSLKRCCNLSSQVIRIPHDKDNYKDVPTIWYEVDGETYIMHTTSREIFKYNIGRSAKWDFVPKILYSDFSIEKSYNPSKTPIAIMVAPANHFSDGKARWMSLVNMSLTDPENGTTAVGNDNNNPGANIRWGWNEALLGEANDQVPSLVCPEVNKPEDSLYDGGLSYGYVPSDFYKKTDEGVPVDYPLDSRYAYFGENGDMSNDNAASIPSPFSKDGLLNDWNRSYALSIENGYELTDLMIKAQTVAWSTGSINNELLEGNYPSACLCRRFAPFNGNGYLPSITELQYVGVNLYSINKLISTIPNSVAVGDYDTQDELGGCLWSSSESSESRAWGLASTNCTLGNSNKNNSYADYRVRAFLAY